jgi:hypothetical protein
VSVAGGPPRFLVREEPSGQWGPGQQTKAIMERGRNDFPFDFAREETVLWLKGDRHLNAHRGRQVAALDEIADLVGESFVTFQACLPTALAATAPVVRFD